MIAKNQYLFLLFPVALIFYHGDTLAEDEKPASADDTHPKDMVTVRCEGSCGPKGHISFMIDKTEVTIGEYLKCVEANRCNPPRCNETDPECHWRHPDAHNKAVNYISPLSASNYCEIKGKRLPTDREWLIAAGAESGILYPWGNQAPTCDVSSFIAFSCDILSVKDVQSTPMDISPFGVYDMGSNVKEWVEKDTKIGGPDYSSMGGSIYSIEIDFRLSGMSLGENRFRVSPEIGFRCAL